MAPDTPPPDTAPDTPDVETASRVWAAMQAFVGAHQPHRELRAAFDFGRGQGRVTLLRRLTSGPMTLREIAEWQGGDKAYATVVVDTLESRRLVERRPHPDDHRRKLVSLTPEGEAAAARAEAIVARPPTDLLGLAPAELAALDAAMTRLARDPSA